MSNIMINLLEVSFLSEEEKDEFMTAVENEDDVFSFDCIGIEVPLESVSFKPVEEGFMFLFLTEEEDVKGEIQVLSETFPGVSFNYLVIAPGAKETIISMQLEGGEVLTTQTIIGAAAMLIGEMAKGGFAG
ncbi:MAG: hypothetical protein OCD02_09080 [Spirochaetaceae bacterium]